MPLLSRAKRNIGKALGSAAMRADAKQTEFCAYLSGILLVGLVLNALLGLWWADPFAALIMIPIIAKEGVEGLRGKSCSECASTARSRRMTGAMVRYKMMKYGPCNSSQAGRALTCVHDL